jgi:hypothetical protein
MKNHMSKDPNHWSHTLLSCRWEELIPHMLYISYRLVGELVLDNVSVLKHHPDSTWIKGDELGILLKTGDVFVSINLSATCNQNHFSVFGTDGYWSNLKVSKPSNISSELYDF